MNMFEIRQESDGRQSWSGRLDANQVPKADAALGKITKSIVLDLAGLDYISSAGLGALVKAQLRLKSRGQAIRVMNVHPRVRPVFHYAQLEETFGIE